MLDLCPPKIPNSETSSDPKSPAQVKRICLSARACVAASPACSTVDVPPSVSAPARKILAMPRQSCIHFALSLLVWLAWARSMAAQKGPPASESLLRIVELDPQEASSKERCDAVHRTGSCRIDLPLSLAVRCDRRGVPRNARVLSFACSDYEAPDRRKSKDCSCLFCIWAPTSSTFQRNVPLAAPRCVSTRWAREPTFSSSTTSWSETCEKSW